MTGVKVLVGGTTTVFLRDGLKVVAAMTGVKVMPGGTTTIFLRDGMSKTTMQNYLRITIRGIATTLQ